MVRRIEVRFSTSKDPSEVLETVAKTRKVVLVAVYARALRQTNTHPSVIHEAIISSSSKKVTRNDIAKLISEQVSRVISGYSHSMVTSTQMEGYAAEAHPDQDAPPNSPIPDVADEPPVLGKEMLAHVWSDMKRTVLPTSISPVPREVGSPRAGKLTADQWRTFCTVHLTVTLTRLWGDMALGDRRAKMLDNFLHLITFTNLLHLRALSPDQIALIERENLAYLTGLRRIYPQFSLVPKHHMSLHLPVMLRDFGPVHAWRTFAFERLNQVYQNVATNSLSGALLLRSLSALLILAQVNLNGRSYKDFA